MEKKAPVTAPVNEYWKNPITIMLGCMVLFFATQILGIGIASLFAPLIQSENYKMALYVALNLVVFMALLSILMQVFKFNFKHIGCNKVGMSAYVRIIPAFFIYFAISAAFTVIATKFIDGFNVEEAQDIGFSALASNFELVATFVSLVIITPIFEELIFRGILFRGLRRKTSFWLAAVLTSIVFAVAHMQWNVAVDTFALSLVLCYLVEKTNSIYPVIALHAVKNSLAFVLLFILT